MVKTAQFQKIICAVGTRPEFIKLYPVYRALKEVFGSDVVLWLETGQHGELLEDLYEFFELQPDFVLDIVSTYEFLRLQTQIDADIYAVNNGLENRDNREESDALHLTDLGASLLASISRLFASENPDLVLVQGDTLSAQQAALAAFYHKIPVAHIEAGLRTDDIYSPFPEEFARRLIDMVASYKFVPSEQALVNLEKESCSKDAIVVGNTVIDSLNFVLKKTTDRDFAWDVYAQAKRLLAGGKKQDFNLHEFLQNDSKKILVTSHRRENIGRAQENLVAALYTLAKKNPEVEFVLSLHKNPQARKSFEKLLQKGLENVKIFEAINYPLFVSLMQSSYLIVTDSGGIQEEASYLEKPTFVFRNKSDRPETIEQGIASYLSLDEESIVSSVEDMICNQSRYQEFFVRSHKDIYGLGDASQKIVDKIGL